MTGSDDHRESIVSDDADMSDVVQTVSAALQDAARHIGKADQAITETQIEELEAAIEHFQRALKFAKERN